MQKRTHKPMKTNILRISLILNVFLLLSLVFFLIRYKGSRIASLLRSQKTTIAMYGDSRVQQVDWSIGLKRYDVLNAGISGFTTPQLFDFLNAQVVRFHPQICILEAGINDIRTKVSLDSTLSAYTKIIDTLTANHIKVVVNSVIPVSKDPFQYEVPDSIINDKVEELNNRLIEICKSKGIDYLDINQELAENKRFKLKYTLDGVHLHPEGYKVWFEYVNKTLEKKRI